VFLEIHTVVAGDTLWEIAQQYGVTVKSLLAANPQITDRSLIRPGDRITITPRVIDLGMFGGYPTMAHDINNLGQIVGQVQTASGYWHAFVWEGGVWTDLGTLGGPYSSAVAINEHGQIVGPSSGNSAGRAFLWQDGAMTDLGTLGGTGATVPTDINDRGQVVGAANPSGEDQHAFLWRDGVMTDLGTLGGTWSFANGINDRGQVVGATSLVGGYRDDAQHAFLWQDGTMTDLGTLGGTSSFASAINDRGQIVGTSRTADGARHAFLWQDGTMTDLGTLYGRESYAFDINGCGQVVGQGDHEAFLWENGPMVPLGKGHPGDNSEALAINDHGQIVGWSGITSDEHAIVWQIGPPEAILSPPGIALIAPARGATIVQNDPSTGCPPNATRGYGLAVTFAWNPLPVEGVSGYRLVVRRIGALYPALDMRVEAPGWTWMDCNGFVADRNLDDWYWQITALDGANQVLAVSEQRSFSFLPCRLSDGRTPCTAPG